VWKAYPDWGAWAAVMRQFLYTMADIFSKVIYGVLLTSVAQMRSAVEGYEPAKKVIIDSEYNYEQTPESQTGAEYRLE
jgi:hypothetical protein